MSARRTAALALALVGCQGSSGGGGEAAGGGPAPAASVAGRTPQDTSVKQAARLLPAETYLRSYLRIFGGLSPLDTQEVARGAKNANGHHTDQLFDSWAGYINSLGLPDYEYDIPRGTQTNTLMLATFERLGVALCDRAVEHDLKKAPPVAARAVFRFEVPADGALSEAGFGERFEGLHRTFLGYPVRLAPDKRAGRYFQLYQSTVADAALPPEPGAPPSRFTPAEAGWAAVCQGLVRHPEFHLY